MLGNQLPGEGADFHAFHGPLTHGCNDFGPNRVHINAQLDQLLHHLGAHVLGIARNETIATKVASRDEVQRASHEGCLVDLILH